MGTNSKENLQNNKGHDISILLFLRIIMTSEQTARRKMGFIIDGCYNGLFCVILPATFSRITISFGKYVEEYHLYRNLPYIHGLFYRFNKSAKNKRNGEHHQCDPIDSMVTIGFGHNALNHTR